MLGVTKKQSRRFVLKLFSVYLYLCLQRDSQKAAQAQRREKTLPAESRENSKQVAFELGLEG